MRPSRWAARASAALWASRSAARRQVAKADGRERRLADELELAGRRGSRGELGAPARACARSSREKRPRRGSGRRARASASAAVASTRACARPRWRPSLAAHVGLLVAEGRARAPPPRASARRCSSSAGRATCARRGSPSRRGRGPRTGAPRARSPPPGARRRRRRGARPVRGSQTSAIASSGSIAPVSVVPALATTAIGATPSARSASIAAASSSGRSRRRSSSLEPPHRRRTRCRAPRPRG